MGRGNMKDLSSTESLEDHTSSIDIIHQQWVATLDAVRFAIVVLDGKSNIIRANQSFASLANTSVEDTIHQNVFDLLPWLVEAEGRIANVIQSTPCGQVFQIVNNGADLRLYGEIYIFEDVTSESVFAVAEKTYHLNSNKALVDTIETLSRAHEITDPYSVLHSLNVADISKGIALAMGLSDSEAVGIFYGAQVHDIGKLNTPSSILNKPGRLAHAEINLIRMHPETGYSIVKDLEFPWPIHDIILQHHERLDGTGYPAGLKGDEISFAAQIVSVADVVESMTSHRPYRPALGQEVAFDELKRGRGVSYNSDVVDTCIDILSQENRSIGTRVLGG